ncbi:MAG: copper resistance protein CopC [Sphaerobacter sp.]|nr:copper resistance protein CopC [Sphaerobacter sp.]
MRDIAGADRLRRARCLRLALLALLAVALTILSAPAARAHGELDTARSQPSPGSVHGVSPATVELWFTEPLDPARSAIEVYDAERQRVDNGDAAVDPADPQHMRVSLPRLLDGTYTVAWRSASAVDGHVLQGTFDFRVGQARLPAGAATSSGERPAAPAVALRWLTLLGLAVTAGWWLLGLLGAPGSARARRLAVGGAAVALLADLALVPMQAYLPPGDLPRQTLRDALAVMPGAWLSRVGIEVAVVVLLAQPPGRRRGAAALRLGAALTAAAVLTLTFTSHAAAREAHRSLAVALNAAHLGAVAFWIGGVVHLAAAPRLRSAAGGEALRRFSRLALVLAPVALASGAANAGVLLPSVAALWGSDYGRVILLKTGIAVGILGLAWFNRRQIERGLRRAVALLRALRGEALLGMGALLAAAVLALSAPPEPARIEPLHLRVALDGDRYAHLFMARPDAGSRELTVWLSGPDGAPLPEVQRAQVTPRMLERPIDLPRLRAERQEDGRWRVARVPLNVKGWWQVDVEFGGVKPEPAVASFYFLLPDPIFVGPEERTASDPAAVALYQSVLERLTQLTSVRSREHLTDGTGNSVVSQYSWAAPDRLHYVTSSGSESIAIGQTQYYREAAGRWVRRQRPRPVDFPGALQGYYSDPRGLTLGRELELDGVRCRLVSFFAPANEERGDAWYLWWVDAATHQIRREAMVANHHYMVTDYVEFDAPVAIQAPE